MKVNSLIVILAVAISASAGTPPQVRTVTGTRIPGPTWTPTLTPTLTPTPTETPIDPCAGCPDLDSWSCQMWPQTCYQCWEDCGNPQATPTPTRTRTPTATATPTITPTPVGPPCILHVDGPGSIYLVAFWAHESPTYGERYTFAAPSLSVPPGPHSARPDGVEGYPIGYEWWNAVSGELLKSCGDTSKIYPRTPTPTPTPPPSSIFADGFESGDTSRWSSTVGGA